LKSILMERLAGIWPSIVRAIFRRRLKRYLCPSSSVSALAQA